MTLETAAANTDYGTSASGSSFLCGDAPFCRASSARRCFRSTSFLPAGRRHRGFRWPAALKRLAALQQWRDDIDALYQGHPPARLQDYVCVGFDDFDLPARGFPGYRRMAWKWTCRRIFRAAWIWQTLDLYCDPRGGAQSERLSVRGVWAGVGRRYPARAPSWPSAAIDQYPARRR